MDKITTTTKTTLNLKKKYQLKALICIAFSIDWNQSFELGFERNFRRIIRRKRRRKICHFIPDEKQLNETTTKTKKMTTDLEKRSFEH